MTVKFALVLSLFFTVSKHISSSILSSQLLTDENQKHLTSINAPGFLKANRDSDIYETSLKNSENAKLTQTHFGTEAIHIKRKESGLHYEDKTPLRFNFTKAENINSHNFPINKTTKDQIPFKINSSKSEKINLYNFLINQTTGGQNVELKKMQFDVINNPHEKANITSNTTKNIKKMETRFKKVSPNGKNKAGTDAKSDKYALKKVFQVDFYKSKSDFQRNFQNINAANLKHGHWLEMRPLRKRKIRDATIYPKELEPVFRKFFPEDFTTKETHLYSNNFRKLSDLNIPTRSRLGRKERYKNRNSLTRRRKGKKPSAVPIGYEPFYFRAADETTVSSSNNYQTKILTVIIPLDEKGSTIDSIVKIIQGKQDNITSTVSDSGTKAAVTASPTGANQDEATSSISQTGTEITKAGTNEDETTSIISQTETKISTAASQTEITTEQTGTKQTDNGQSKTETSKTEQPGIIKDVPNIENTGKSEHFSSLNPEVNYHYHFHYFGHVIPPTPPGLK